MFQSRSLFQGIVTASSAAGCCSMSRPCLPRPKGPATLGMHFAMKCSGVFLVIMVASAPSTCDAAAELHSTLTASTATRIWNYRLIRPRLYFHYFYGWACCIPPRCFSFFPGTDVSAAGAAEEPQSIQAHFCRTAARTVVLSLLTIIFTYVRTYVREHIRTHVCMHLLLDIRPWSCGRATASGGTDTTRNNDSEDNDNYDEHGDGGGDDDSNSSGSDDHHGIHTTRK